MGNENDHFIFFLQMKEKKNKHITAKQIHGKLNKILRLR